MSRREGQAIRFAHLRDRHLTATETALNTTVTHNCLIHHKTVRYEPREVNFIVRCPYVGLPLTSLRRQRRMNWQHAHAPGRFRMIQWRRVLFMDESRFTLFWLARRRRVY